MMASRISSLTSFSGRWSLISWCVRKPRVLPILMSVFSSWRRLATSSSVSVVSSRPNSRISARSLARLTFMRSGLALAAFSVSSAASTSTSASASISTSPLEVGVDVGQVPSSVAGALPALPGFASVLTAAFGAALPVPLAAAFGAAALAWRLPWPAASPAPWLRAWSAAAAGLHAASVQLRPCRPSPPAWPWPRWAAWRRPWPPVCGVFCRAWRRVRQRGRRQASWQSCGSLGRAVAWAARAHTRSR